MKLSDLQPRVITFDQKAPVKVEEPKAERPRVRGITAALSGLEVGQEIEFAGTSRHSIYQCAKNRGIRVTLKAVGAERYRIRRTA